MESEVQLVSFECTLFKITTRGRAKVQKLDIGTRTARAMKTLGVLWGVAFVAIFIPVLHFLLVPLFLLVGVLMGVLTWFDTSQIVSGEIECPNCSAKVVLPMLSERWPRTERCPSCYMMLELKKI